MLNVLLLVQKDQRVILDRLYDGICRYCNCDVRRLSSNEQDELGRYFSRNVDLNRYDRVVLFLRFKKEIEQASFISRIPNLVILEHDAYQNFIPGKYSGKFSRHYRQLPSARVITSGGYVAERLRHEGVDAVFVPKGYDQALLKDLGRARDIELGFVGSYAHKTYGARKALLEELAMSENLLITRTRSGQEYLETLNRIRFFVSADVGFGEYMIKNFEAMACGCLLITYDQGHLENKLLGFEDMVNVVTYKSVGELRGKLATLRQDTSLAKAIADEGKKLVENRYSYDLIGKQIVDAIAAPLRPYVRLRFWQRWKARRAIPHSQ